jgi:hypothetical protein
VSVLAVSVLGCVRRCREQFGNTLNTEVTEGFTESTETATQGLAPRLSRH